MHFKWNECLPYICVLNICTYLDSNGTKIDFILHMQLYTLNPRSHLHLNVCVVFICLFKKLRVF